MSLFVSLFHLLGALGAILQRIRQWKSEQKLRRKLRLEQRAKARKLLDRVRIARNRAGIDSADRQRLHKDDGFRRD